MRFLATAFLLALTLTPGFDDSKWKAATEMGPTLFARALYGSEPRSTLFVNRFSAAAAAIEQGLRVLRSARDTETALKSLDAIEKAVMRARRKIWDQHKPKDADKR